MKLDENDLHALLREEAETIIPAGDGLAKIQRRVERRRNRLRWMRPALAVTAAGALIVAGAVTYGQVTHDDQSVHLPADGLTQSPAPSPSGAAVPGQALWSGPDGASWRSDADQTALHFLSDHLQMPYLDTVVASTVRGDSAEVAVGRGLPSETKRAVAATTITLQRASGTWYVESARADLLTVTTTSVNASTVTVSGRLTGVDESIQVELLAGDSPQPLAHASTPGGGQDSPWQVTLERPVTDATRLTVVVYLPSALDGNAARVVALALDVGDGPGPTAAYPTVFFAASDGRIAKLSSTDGSVISSLTQQQPGGGDSDPQLVGNQVYFLRGAGSCANTLLSVPTSGGGATGVYTPSNATVTGYAVSSDGHRLAVVEQSCADAGQQRIVVSDSSTGTTATTPWAAQPPSVEGDPAWSPDGTQLAATVRTGTLWGVRVWNPFTATSPLDGRALVSPHDGCALSDPVWTPDSLAAAEVCGPTSFAVAFFDPTTLQVRSYSPSIPAGPSGRMAASSTGVLLVGTGGGDTVGPLLAVTPTAVTKLTPGGCVMSQPSAACPNGGTW